MADRFDEMAERSMFNHDSNDLRLRAIADSLRSTWNEAIEAAARQYDGTVHEAFARAIRELKEPKR